MIERKAHKTLHQREGQFDQQITEYREKLEQANLTNQHLQSELEKLQEEKMNFKDTITSLTQNLETLKTELQDRGWILSHFLSFLFDIHHRSNRKYGI
jgi:chromosome segregation ATPase